ncbi:MAG: tetratricopeptide repeat protein [Acidiferrobacterales bacterium]
MKTCTAACRILLWSLLALACLVPVAAAAAPDTMLRRVAALVRGGAAGLALRLIDRDQPPPQNVTQWMAWEKERYAAYAVRHDWNALSQRACNLPSGIPDDFVQWTLVEAAQARLSARDGAGARLFLRRLLWRERGTTEVLARWRRMVIRSYLVDNDLADAETAILRYEQDFNVRSDSWNALRGTTLLREGRNRSAMSVLAGVRTYEGRLLLLLAGLRSGNYEPARVLARALYIVHVTARRPGLQRQAWILAADAAERAGNAPQRLSALEHALDFPRATRADDPLFHVDADDLWKAYDSAANRIGNRSRLIVGDDGAWLDKAAVYGRVYAPYARALYAFLAFHAGSPETRELAIERLADSFYAAHDSRLAQVLFTRSTRFRSLARIPDPVRYRLVDHAIADDDIAFAGRVMQSLKNPPHGENADEWTLRRARVLIYAGNLQAGLALLSGVLDGKAALDDLFVRHYLQVIFELQTAGANRSAEVLLRTLFPLVKNPEIRRQILFWMADSDKALGKYTRAAELYLRSATYDGAAAGDMWGQTARYNAAYALAKAGLIADARSVYQQLLQSTHNPDRRTAIERRLQQLWLLASKTAAQR